MARSGVLFACTLLLAVSSAIAADVPPLRKISARQLLQATASSSAYASTDVQALNQTLINDCSSGVDPTNVIASAFTAAYILGRDHSTALANAWAAAIGALPEPGRTACSNVYAQGVIFALASNTTAAAEALVSLGVVGTTYQPVVTQVLNYAFQNGLQNQAASTIALGIQLTSAGTACPTFDMETVYTNLIISSITSGARNLSNNAIVAGYLYGCGTANTVTRALLEVVANTTGTCGCSAINPVLASAYAYASAQGNAVQVFSASVVKSTSVLNCVSQVLAVQASATATAVASANATATIIGITQAVVNSTASASAAATIITNTIAQQGCMPFIITVLQNISASASAAASATSQTTTINGVTTTSASATASAFASVLTSSQLIIGCLNPTPTPSPIPVINLPPAPVVPLGPVTTTATTSVTAIAVVTTNALIQYNTNAAITNIVISVTNVNAMATATATAQVVETFISQFGCTRFVQTIIIEAAASAGASAYVNSNGVVTASATASASVFIQTFFSSSIIKGCVLPSAPPTGAPPARAPSPPPVDFAAQLNAALLARNTAQASSIISASVAAGLLPTLSTLNVINQYLTTKGCDGTCFTTLVGANTAVSASASVAASSSTRRHLLQNTNQATFAQTYLATPGVVSCLNSRVAPGPAPASTVPLVNINTGTASPANNVPSIAPSANATLPITTSPSSPTARAPSPGTTINIPVTPNSPTVAPGNTTHAPAPAPGVVVPNQGGAASTAKAPTPGPSTSTTVITPGGTTPAPAPGTTAGGTTVKAPAPAPGTTTVVNPTNRAPAPAPSSLAAVTNPVITNPIVTARVPAPAPGPAIAG